jgi:tetratricopeptide (TPR) repeat protein
LRLEKVALENRIKQMSATVALNNSSAGAAAPGDTSRIKQLENERDGLQKRLDTANKELSGRKGKGNAGRVQDLENQLALVRARLEIVEAQVTPYSAEELALLKGPQPKLAEADPNAGKKSIRELPAGSADLVREAQRAFAAKEYDKAEAAYTKVLQQDPKNVPALANLAVIQAEAEHFDRAESNVKQALSVDPEDPYSLYVLGILRFRQGKYDEALDALSHSAKLDPQNAEVQNYLGLALSEKGMRVPAEAALRKAIQLQPGYAGAHYNLAVVYATQQPPAIELARWHYQKAIAAGHPHNADLEKRFEARK